MFRQTVFRNPNRGLTMSHKHRPLTNRKNVLHIFTKHNKLHKHTRVIPNCNSDSSHAKRKAQSVNGCKIKRLKTRKERSQMREGRGQEHIEPHCFQQCRRENRMACCHSCSHSRPLCPPSKENVVTMAERGQDPCIITDARLIGHRGLFNHEVKSVDIERLVSKRMKSKLHSCGAAGVHSEDSTNSSTLAQPSCPLSPSPVPNSGYVGVSNLAEETRQQERAESMKYGVKAGLHIGCGSRARIIDHTSGKSQENVVKSNASTQVCLGDNTGSNVSYKNANVNNSPMLCTTPSQSAVHLEGLVQTFDCEPEVYSSASSRGLPIIQRDRSQPQPQARKWNQESLRTEAAGREMERCTDSRRKNYSDVYTPKQSSKDTGPLNFNMQSLKYDGRWGGEERFESGTGDCAAVAVRLCQAVELPQLCRRHLLAETRETLVQTLQERHGPQLKGNLLRLQQQLCYSKRQTDRAHTAGHMHWADSRKDSNSGTQASGCRENDSGLEYSRPTSHRLTPNKRRRKQMLPQRMEQHFTDSQHRDMAVQWNTSLIVEPAVDPSGKFTKTHSPQLVMDFLPSVSSSPPIFASSVWEGQTGPPLTQDRQFQMGQEKVTDHVQSSGYSPELCFFSQTKNLENTRPPFLYYSAMPLVGAPRDVVHWPQRPPINQISNFNASSSPPCHCPIGHLHLQTHNSIHKPPTNPRSYRPDMSYYPSSDLLERVMSPPLPLLPPYPSSEHWLFPRMRLY